MIALLEAIKGAVEALPELLPLLRELVQVIAGDGTKDEKLTRARRAVEAAAGRTALDEALPGA